MELTLECVAVELDAAGYVKARLNDCSGMAARLDGAEIDGVRFMVSESGNREDAMEIVMQGPDLSDAIRANYPAPPRSPVSQVAFKSPDARFTANTLNKLMRRVNKEFPRKALLVRDVKGLE